MSTINEQIVTGRAHRVLIDKVAKLWQRISFWTKASDVEFNDGNTAETKVGAIKGITTDLNTTETGYAADMTALTELKTQLNSEIQGINIPSVPKIQRGIIPVNYSSTASQYTLAFPEPFSKQPVIVVSPAGFNTTGHSYRPCVSIGSVTRFAANINYSYDHATEGTGNIEWIAIEI